MDVSYKLKLEKRFVLLKISNGVSIASLVGRCSIDEARISPLGDVAATPPPCPAPRPNPSLIMLLAGPLIVVASSLPTERPSIALIDRDYQRTVTLVCESTPPALVQVTALALDQSPPNSSRLSVAVFLSTGEISIISFNPMDPSTLRQSLHFRPSRYSSRTHIVDAAYYHPLLVTLADPFSLSLFDLSSGSVRHTQTLTAFTCYPPASLVLSCKCTTEFRLIITYTIPVYPRHWSVGVTEIRISNVADMGLPMPSHTGLFSAPSFREEFRSSAFSMAVISTRTIRAFDVPNGWIDNACLLLMREQWGRKLLNVASVQTDGKWVIVAPGNDLFSSSIQSHGSFPTPSTSHTLRSSIGLQLYRLVLPSHSSSISASPPRLVFVRTLHGHTSPISALALADGRCISLDEKGRIWAWDLEAGGGAEVTSSDKNSTDSAVLSMNGIISFDERRIVSAIAGKVVVRRFDI